MDSRSRQLRVGCAMWAHKAWVGPFLPASTRAGHELAAYATWCTSVEGNTTFYAVPPLETVRRWADATPTDFRFVCKLPRTVTHERRLRGADAEVLSFLRLLEPLGERVEQISIQLPPTFGPSDLSVLATFLRRATRSIRWAVEVRHPEFFDGSRAHAWLDRTLVDTGAERIILDTRTLYSKPPTDAAEREGWGKKPRVPVVDAPLTDRPIVRFIGRTDIAETVAGWQPWVAAAAEWLGEGRLPTVFVHTPDNVAALGLARRFHDEVRARVPDLAPLPTPMAVADAPDGADDGAQLRLFG